MANSPQARKRSRQAVRRRTHNVDLRSRFRTHLKSVTNLISDGDKEKASAAFTAATPIIDGMVTKGLIHRNKAARHKSRLNAQIKAMS